jgi:hypothetical protein
MTETGLRRILAQYLAQYHHSRTHLALNKDAPVSRPVTAQDRSSRFRSSAGSIIDTVVVRRSRCYLQSSLVVLPVACPTSAVEPGAGLNVQPE